MDARPGAAGAGASRAAKKRAKRKGLPPPEPAPAAAKKQAAPVVEQLLHKRREAASPAEPEPRKKKKRSGGGSFQVVPVGYTAQAHGGGAAAGSKASQNTLRQAQAGAIGSKGSPPQHNPSPNPYPNPNNPSNTNPNPEPDRYSNQVCRRAQGGRDLVPQVRPRRDALHCLLPRPGAGAAGRVGPACLTSAVIGSGTARMPGRHGTGSPGMALQASGCDTHPRRAAEPPRARQGGDGLNRVATWLCAAHPAAIQLPGGRPFSRRCGGRCR